MLYLHLRLIQSALGQKVEAEPVGNHRGRSQRRAAMGGVEVASFPGEAGPPMGQSAVVERASPFRAKFGLSAPSATGRVAAYAVSGQTIALVLPAVTPCTQHVRFTDEVPRRPVLEQVSLDYKSHTKGRGYASAAGMAFPQPCRKGCQQRQSRGLRPGRSLGLGACSERQNLRVPPGPLRSMGPVSPVDKATTWPVGTSSPQSSGPLSNSPPQPKTGQAAVRSR